MSITPTDILPTEIWARLIDKYFIPERPTHSNEKDLVSLMLTCRFFQDIIKELNSSPHRAILLSKCYTYEVLASDTAWMSSERVDVFHRHVAFVYGPSYWWGKQGFKIVDLQSGTVGYLSGSRLLSSETSWDRVLNVDSTTAYTVAEGNLNATNLLTGSETVLLSDLNTDRLCRQSSNGKVIQGIKYSNDPFVVYKDGKEIAKIQHPSKNNSPLKLFDFKVDNNLLCAIYNSGEYCLYFHDIEHPERTCTRIFQLYTESYFFDPEVTSLRIDEHGRSSEFSPLLFCDQFFVYVGRPRVGQPFLPITILFIERKKDELTIYRAVINLDVSEGSYRFALSNGKLLIAEHAKKSISIWKASKDEISELEVVQINVLQGVSFSEDSIFAFQNDLIAIASGKEISLYSIHEDSKPNARRLGFLQTNDEIKKLQFDLDKKFPQLTAVLKNNTVQTWTPKATIAEESLITLAVSVLKAIYQWTAFLVTCVIPELIILLIAGPILLGVLAYEKIVGEE